MFGFFIGRFSSSSMFIVHGRLDAIITKLNTIITKEEHMSAELDALKAEVTETKGVMQSAKVLIDGFAARLQTAIDAAVAAGGTATEFVAMKEELDAESTALAESVAANP